MCVCVCGGGGDVPNTQHTVVVARALVGLLTCWRVCVRAVVLCADYCVSVCCVLCADCCVLCVVAVW